MIIFLILLASLGLSFQSSFAQEQVTFGPSQTTIIGSIPYTVIGKYTAHFNDFKGKIVFDDRFSSIQSVYLSINAKSIQSNSPLCDKLARSRRLLNTARYPKIIFKSEKIIHSIGGYQVIGILVMHGIKKRMTFPFRLRMFKDQRSKNRWLDLSGDWSIDRREFKIIWNRFLDHGGLLVGNYLTVHWGIKIPMN